MGKLKGYDISNPEAPQPESKQERKAREKREKKFRAQAFRHTGDQLAQRLENLPHHTRYDDKRTSGGRQNDSWRALRDALDS